jgi:hypothetical protein
MGDALPVTGPAVPMEFAALRPSFLAHDGSERVPLGALQNSRIDCGCFALTDEMASPEPLGAIGLEGFFARLRPLIVP